MLSIMGASQEKTNSGDTLECIDANGYGAVAQLGERYVRNVEVVGSIPTGSTI